MREHRMSAQLLAAVWLHNQPSPEAGCMPPRAGHRPYCQRGLELVLELLHQSAATGTYLVLRLEPLMVPRVGCEPFLIGLLNAPVD